MKYSNEKIIEQMDSTRSSTSIWKVGSARRTSRIYNFIILIDCSASYKEHGGMVVEYSPQTMLTFIQTLHRIIQVIEK